MTSGPQLLVVVPVLDRPQRVGPLLESLEQATSVSHRALFVCTPGDEAEIAALNVAGAEILLTTWEAGPGDFSRKTNLAYRESEEPWIFCGADDLLFEPGWDEAALQVAEQHRAGVTGTNDTANALVKKGLHATHSLIRRSYIEEQGGTFDGTGEIYSETYDHQWTDSELVETAKLRRQWAFARDSLVRHLHPHWGTAEMDWVYEKGQRATKEDFALYVQRIRRLRKLHAGQRRALRYNASR